MHKLSRANASSGAPIIAMRGPYHHEQGLFAQFRNVSTRKRLVRYASYHTVFLANGSHREP